MILRIRPRGYQLLAILASSVLGAVLAACGPSTNAIETAVAAARTAEPTRTPVVQTVVHTRIAQVTREVDATRLIGVTREIEITVEATRVVVITATSAPTATASPTPSPTAAPDAVVGGVAINMRDGPSTAYRAIAALEPGTELVVTGVNQDRTWLLVETEDVEGWVYAPLCTVGKSLEDSPVINAPVPTAVPEQTMPPPEEIITSLEYRTPGRKTGTRYLRHPGGEWSMLSSADLPIGLLYYHNHDPNTWGGLGRIEIVDEAQNQTAVNFNLDPDCSPNYEHGDVGMVQGGMVCGQRSYTVSSVLIRSALYELGSDLYPSGYDAGINNLEAGDLVWVVGSPTAVVEGNGSVVIHGFQ